MNTNTIGSNQQTNLRLGAALLVLLFSLGAQAQMDDFSSGNDNGWCRVDPLGDLGVATQYPGLTGLASWTVANGAYTLHCDAPPVDYAGAFGPARVGSTWTNAAYYYTNFYVSVDTTNWLGTPAPAIGILARLQDPFNQGVTAGYSLTYEPKVHDFQISTLFWDGTYAQTAVTNIDLPSTNWYRFVLLGRADYLEARVYTAGATEPLATISANESTYANGWCGIFAYNSQGGLEAGAEATFDNYLAQAEEPVKLSIELAGTQVQLGWPTWANTYKLQSSATMATGSWATITTGIVSNETGFSYTCPATNKNFFRLSQ